MEGLWWASILGLKLNTGYDWPRDESLYKSARSLMKKAVMIHDSREEVNDQLMAPSVWCRT